MRGMLAVHDAEVAVAARQGAIALMRGGQEVRRVPLHKISEVLLFGAVELSAAARRLLLGAGIDTVLLTPRGQYLGRLIGAESRAGERRLAQLTRLLDTDFALAMARRVVIGKLVNQRTYVQRLRRDRPDDELHGAVAGIGQMLRQLDRAGTVAELMGYEGRAGVLYYRALGKALSHPELSFERRTRRPPRDPLNACLSFGYTLLLARVESAIRRMGLDPHIGALHQPGRGKPALALDLMEAFRVLVERLVWRLANRRQLGPGDFEEPTSYEEELSLPGDPLDGGLDAGGDEGEPAPPVYLARTGRAVLLAEWGRLWRQTFLYEERGIRMRLDDILDAQVQSVTRSFESGELAWSPWQLRG